MRNGKWQMANGKFLLILFLFLILITCRLSLVQAADSTSSAQVSSPSATIKEKIDEIKKEIASKAASLVPYVNKKLANKAYWGIISEKTDNRIVVDSNDSQREIITNEYTIYQSSSRKTPRSKRASLASGDFLKDNFISALGDIDDNGVLTAKKVIKLDTFKIEEKVFFWGRIESRRNSSITLKLKNSSKQEILTDISTDFFLGREESSILDAKLGKFMVARGYKSQEGSFFADYVYFIPTAGFIKPESKIASPSATTTPSSSVKN